MTETAIDTSQKNINLETVENCNLLCKLILDYMDTDKCVIERLENQSFRIVYPEGSFINHKDTNYELTYAYFFYPSRHSIDGQKYDLEINLYHGNFIDGTNNNDKKTGMVAHTHYHNDDTDTNLHKHFHYHLPEDTELPHQNTNTDPNNKNIITCLMYNKGKHDGSDLNIFFNQFVHHPYFRSFANLTSGEKEIQVHDHWSIEKLYPKKRSFFIYDDNNTGNTFVVFDTVQTISKELIDRLYVRGIKGTDNFDISKSSNFVLQTPDRVMYRKNIEVITDAAYKRSMRAQIKDLLSLTRMSTYKPSSRTSREYNEIGDSIDSYVNGDNVGFFANEDKSKEISKMWDFYAKDYGQELTLDLFEPGEHNKIQLNAEYIKKYKYSEKILAYSGFVNPDSPWNFLRVTRENNVKKPVEDYFTQREALVNLFNRWNSWNEEFTLNGQIYKWPEKENISMIGRDELFKNMFDFYGLLIAKFIVNNKSDGIRTNSLELKQKYGFMKRTQRRVIKKIGNIDHLMGDNFFYTVERIYRIIDNDAFKKWENSE